MREASSIGAALTPALSPRERGRGGADNPFSRPEEEVPRRKQLLLPRGEGGRREPAG
jgi:hypothetical protein